MPTTQSPNSSPVDQVAASLMDTLNAEVPPDTRLIALPPSKASSLVVASADDRAVCSMLLGETKKRIAAVEEDRKRLTRPLDALKKMIMEKYQPALTFFMGEKAIYEGKLMLWDAEQDRLRAAEEARVRMETEVLRQAEIAKAQEAERIEREKAAEMLRLANAEQDAARREQMRLEALARDEEAIQESAMRQEQAAMISTPTVAASGGKIQGESDSWKYSAECADLRTLVKAVAEGRMPLSAVEFSQVGANKLANALQDEFRAQYPEAACGVRLVKVPVYTHRRRK